MVTWHLTMKLFPAKCHERATLRKLWRQTGNSSLLPAKCWSLLHMIARISVRFSNFAFVLFCYITNHLMTGPLGNSKFSFPRIPMFPSTSSRETKFTVPLGTSHKVFIMSLADIHSCYFLFQLVEEMATSAGLQCELDPVLCQALRVHKGVWEIESVNSFTWVVVL